MGGEIRHNEAYNRHDFQKTNPQQDRLHEEVYKNDLNELRSIEKMQSIKPDDMKGFPAVSDVFNFIHEQGSALQKFAFQDKQNSELRPGLSTDKAQARLSKWPRLVKPGQLPGDYQSAVTSEEWSQLKSAQAFMDNGGEPSAEFDKAYRDILRKIEDRIYGKEVSQDGETAPLPQTDSTSSTQSSTTELELEFDYDSNGIQFSN